MFRRPWQIWLTYVLILALLLPGLAWLSLRVLELDSQERLSRARAEQEERISLALWRMESVAMPIVAAEAARPAFVYQPYQAVPGGHQERIPSPLLRPPSDYVLLNFQVGADGCVQSPQVPAPSDQEWACSNGTTALNIALCCPRVETLQSELHWPNLRSCLPAQEAPQTPAQVAMSPDSSDPIEAGQQVAAAEQLANGTYVQNAEPLPATNSGSQEPRPSADYANRASKLQSFAVQSALQQRQNLDVSLLRAPVREGVSRALWFDDKLLLARRVTVGEDESVQGCWLNWDRLRTDLLSELGDLLPAAKLQPVSLTQTAAPGRTLASLPVELIAPPLTSQPFAGTPTQIALAIAWSGLLAGCLALAFLLHGVSSLSERRAAFVSAVTHELRTPLTTFQLYSEMLAGGMVQDPQQQTEYIDTLHREAGRLGHLIDNVLAYSRLERQPARRERPAMSVEALLSRVESRLTTRAALAGLELECHCSNAAGESTVSVEPTVVEQVLLNLVDNACKYASDGAAGHVILTGSIVGLWVELRLADAGPGLAADVRRRLFRPFSKSDLDAARSAPGVGLGLALSRQLARGEGGDLLLEQSDERGTTFLLRLPRLRA